MGSIYISKSEAPIMNNKIGSIQYFLSSFKINRKKILILQYIQI